MQNPEEKWQAEVNGEVYDTNFGELTVWIAQSSLLESDKVRRGKLRWLDAGKVPPLRAFFNAKANGTEPPFVQVTTSEPTVFEDGGEVLADGEVVQNQDTHNVSDNQFYSNTTEPQFQDEFAEDVKVCTIHSELQADFYCETCFHDFCFDCPQENENNSKACPYCGANCTEIIHNQKVDIRDIDYEKDIAEGFTFGDFGKALAYPFKFKSSLFFGGLFIAFFAIGQNAAKLGSFFMLVPAIICYMFANAISFGVLANTVENFSQGYKERNFMPTFDEFSAWDDVIQPFFLSIAVWISSFGLLVLLLIGALWYSVSSFTNEMANGTDTTFTTTPSSIQSKERMTAMLDKFKAENEKRMNMEVDEDGLTSGQRLSLNEEESIQNANDFANNYRKQQLEGAIGKTPETMQKEQSAMFMKVVKSAGLMLFLCGLALLWGIFYFPAACAVAGYTRSFSATINPLVGLDTIKTLGFDYVKILVMWFIIGIMSAIAGGILALVLSPFSLPRFGNLPAQFFGSFVTLYFTAVFAVFLGYAMYKNSDKFQFRRR